MSPAQSNSRVCKNAKQDTRRSRSEKTKATQCTGCNARHAFLKHRFMPAMEDCDPDLFGKKSQLEREFFTSLSNLANLYKFEMPDVSQKPFPYNIAFGFREARSVLKEIDPDLTLLIVQDEHHLACLTTILPYDTGTMLYYVPVKPLVGLLKAKERKPASDLLLSVFAYLYQIAKIPYHRDKSSYLYYIYDLIIEWYIESGEYSRDELKWNLKEIKAMRKEGDNIHKLISSVDHLNNFKNRLEGFAPSNSFESDLLELASRTFSLWQSHPQRSIFDSIEENFLYPEIEERISAEFYLSFFWDSEGQLYDNLMEYVNSDTQECRVIEEPVSFQFFNISHPVPTHDLSFEKSMFTLIEDLCTILNQKI